jgi:hypothetical protein
VSRSLLLGLGFSLASCGTSTPAPGGVGSASAARSVPPAATARPLAESAAASASAAPSAVASAPPSSSSSAGADTVPALAGADGAPLPQTEDKPSVTSPVFREFVALVAKAIVSGDPARAHAAFFPLVAYRQVKAIKDPDRDYERRLLAAFDADVREYHRALGNDAASAIFAGIDVPESRAEWMKPGREGNKVGYYRVLRSKLRFTLASGKEKSFELTSMISWRGEWYVVHLSGFD